MEVTMEKRKKENNTNKSKQKKILFSFQERNEKCDTKRLRNRQNEEERMELVEINEDEMATQFRKQMYVNLN